MKNYEDFLIVSDLDGTLIGKNNRIEEGNVQAVNQFVEKGGSFSVATGRSLDNSLKMIQELNLQSPCIFFNGSLVYNVREKKELIRHHLNKKYLIPILQKLMIQFPTLVVEIYTKKGMNIVTKDYGLDPHILIEKLEFHYRSLNEVALEAWENIVFFDSRENLNLVQKNLIDEEVEKNHTLVFSYECFLEILPKNISKAAGVDAIRQMEGYQNKKVIAVGDYDNDIEMLKGADLGIAMGNASANCKAAADFISIDNSGSIIEEIVNNIIPQFDHLKKTK